jgi:hypothetical protein
VRHRVGGGRIWILLGRRNASKKRIEIVAPNHATTPGPHARKLAHGNPMPNGADWDSSVYGAFREQKKWALHGRHIS